MSTQTKEIQPPTEDIHAFLEKTLIEAYLKGKGFTLEGLKSLPALQSKQLMKEASTYASGKLAELEDRAHFMQELHDVHAGE